MSSLSINEWRDKIHQLAVEKGFWEGERNFSEILCLIHSEISEALEEKRSNNSPFYFAGVPDKPEGWGVEVIDALIRILDLCGAFKIDVENVLNAKHEYNKTRPHKHGREF